jgi:folate-binding protein YgfZ
MTPDYIAAITAAALFDTSSTGKLVLTGPDAPMFLGNLSTNDIKNLPLGGGCEAYFCDTRAKVQFAAWIYHVMLGGEHALWVETTPGRNEALAKYLDRYLISERVEIADRTSEYMQFHLAGPNSRAVLEKLLGESLPDLPEFAHLERDLGSIRRHDPVGVPGFDIVCKSRPALDVVEGSPETYETLRIEAGTPLFGPDIDENRFVMEVGRAARAVSYSKGCYLGQEPIVMARDRAGHVNRAFLGMKVLDGGPPPPGTKLFRDGQEVGAVTSSCHSPRLGLPVALGYLRWKNQEPGLRLEAETKQAVEVVGVQPILQKEPEA